MTRKKLKLLKDFYNAGEKGLTIEELRTRNIFGNDLDLSLILTEMTADRWIYHETHQSKANRITGTGEDAMRKEMIFWRSYYMTIAMLIIAFVSLIVSVTALLLTTHMQQPQMQPQEPASESERIQE